MVSTEHPNIRSEYVPRKWEKSSCCFSVRTITVATFAVCFLNTVISEASKVDFVSRLLVGRDLNLNRQIRRRKACAYDDASSTCKRYNPFEGNPVAKYCTINPKEAVRSGGFYYGISGSLLERSIAEQDGDTNAQGVAVAKRKSNNPNVLLSETINELRESLNELREELKLLREFQRGILGSGEEGTRPFAGNGPALNVQRRKENYHKVARSVEVWAEKLLFQEDEDHGWLPVQCNKIFRKTFNPHDTIQCFLKWIPDSREPHDDVKLLNEGKYPCLKAYATLDATYEQVCYFLSHESNLQKYNDLVVRNKDIEEIDDHAKICWGQSPQILFIKPRDFVTFCSHRWKRNGMQVVVNQAVEHDEMPGTEKEEKGKTCRAYALRGANFIWRDPEDPTKTKYAMIAHANPGGNLPNWAMKSAVNTLAPIEPFKLFHKIEKGAQLTRPPPVTSFVSKGNRSSRPGGLSQMGYACFWPNGGGLSEFKVEEELSEEFDEDSERNNCLDVDERSDDL